MGKASLVTIFCQNRTMLSVPACWGPRYFVDQPKMQPYPATRGRHILSPIRASEGQLCERSLITTSQQTWIRCWAKCTADLRPDFDNANACKWSRLSFKLVRVSDTMLSMRICPNARLSSQDVLIQYPGAQVSCPPNTKGTQVHTQKTSQHKKNKKQETREKKDSPPMLQSQAATHATPQRPSSAIWRISSADCSSLIVHTIDVPKAY